MYDDLLRFSSLQFWRERETLASKTNRIFDYIFLVPILQIAKSVARLFALRLALDHTRANVALGGDTGDGLDLLLLWFALTSVTSSSISRPRRAMLRRGLAESKKHTLRYSLLASWYSLVMVGGLPRAKKRARPKRTPDAPRPSMTYMKILVLSPGGASARGP